jgi:hypothetical protein
MLSQVTNILIPSTRVACAKDLEHVPIGPELGAAALLLPGISHGVQVLLTKLSKRKISVELPTMRATVDRF